MRNTSYSLPRKWLKHRFNIDKYMLYVALMVIYRLNVIVFDMLVKKTLIPF